jgi:hypothetical protein
VRRETMRGAIAAALLVVALLTSGMTALLVGSATEHGDSRLAASNAVLAQELGSMTERLDTLAESLDQLTRQDAHFRLLAGLEPLDPEVLQAGIGGPDAHSLETNPLFALDAATADRTFGAATHASALIRRARVLASSWREAESALSRGHARLAATPSIYPTRGRPSSAFSHSRMHPILDRPRPHLGVDIVAPTGTPVVATARGRVSVAGNRGDYGLLVEIDHGHGIVTRYAHLSRAAVRVGQSVERGQNIGAVGTSGLSVGPHLHYEVLVNGRHVNPMRYILEPNVLPD